jgi:hypothetical protein
LSYRLFGWAERGKRRREDGMSAVQMTGISWVK